MKKKTKRYARYAIILAFIILAGVIVWSLVQKEVLSYFAPLTEIEYIETKILAEDPPTTRYIEITEGCGAQYGGSCVNARSAPSLDAPVVMKLRMGIVLRVGTSTVKDAEGREWYRVVFNEWLRYPDRVKGDMFVAKDVVETHDITDETREVATTTKRIFVNRTQQMLYAYEDGELFMKTKISAGRDETPTPRGQFHIYYKTPSRYMQGPIPGISDKEYDLPGVPWDMYFTEDGGAIHGAYWHGNFGTQWSNGCVNLPLDLARTLYEWAPVGTPVIVSD